VERSKIIRWVPVLAAVAAIVWWVGSRGPASYRPTAEQKAGTASSAIHPPIGSVAAAASRSAESKASPDANAPKEPNKPAGSEPNQPSGPGEAAKKEGAAEPNAPPQPAKTEVSKPSEPNAPAGSKDTLEAINLKDVEMKNIVEKIAQWTGKTVIPHDEAMKQKITIYAPQKLPRSKALVKIYNALRMKNFVVEETEDTIFIKPIADAKLGVVPTVQADQPLAAFENKDQVVQKFFRLANFSPTYMAGLVQPLVGEYGFVSADESTRSLLVIDTVSNLMRIEQIIREFDVPEAEQTKATIFEVKHGDPAEIVQLLRILLGVTDLRTSPTRPRDRGERSGPGGQGGPVRPPEGGQGGPPRPDAKATTAASYVIGRAQGPIILIPDTRRKWIIARAAPGDIKQIEEWIKKLDVSEPLESEYEVIPLTYANADEVERSVEQSLRDMPGMELMPSVIIQAAQGQVLVFGRKDLRDMVKRIVAEMDMPVGKFETKEFDLKHADAEQIKTNLDNLYGEGTDSFSRFGYGYGYGRFGAGRRNPSDTVKVIAYSAVNKVTAIASPENMRKIEKQITEWDIALDVNTVKPRIITLQNSDPVQMADLLTKLFTEEQDSSRSLWRMIFWDDMGGQKKKIVGPLYGQLTFEDVPGTKKIIIISKIPEAYDVIEQIIYELDRQEMAEIPKVVQLKYADPEDLSERLNAMFNQEGTPAPIRRSARGLRNYSMDQSNSGGSSSTSAASSRTEGGGNTGGNTGEYTPPWSRSARRSVEEEPISNVIGRVRFIPDPHSKAILSLAPPEFQASIEQTIRDLDVPGMQVMVRATIVAVDHTALTSLGIQLATNPEAFGPLEENSITALNSLTSLATRGSAELSGTPPTPSGSGTIVSVTTDVFMLIDFLIKHTNAKVLNEQTLWTEDNEEASFFKGEKVAFQTNFSVSDTGGRVTSNFEFQRVGMTLAVRPSITPEKNVDMIVNVILSQLTGEAINGQPVRTEMETTTNMIVADTETLMLGGILFQKDSRIKRKLPLLGDLPLIGGLFQHNDVALSNNELIVFITPFVINEGVELSGAAKQNIEEAKNRLEQVQQELGTTAEKLDEELNKE
jgi:general secretion pathway protein D